MPLPVRTAEGAATDETHATDEGIRFDATREGIGAVKLLQEGGGITAANCQPDLRRRRGAAGGQRTRAEVLASAEAAGAHPQ